jgi:GntR family transcriptional regulator
MEFRDSQAIYLQIVEYVNEQILLKIWKPGHRIISIREMAIQMQVTPNTAQRAFDFLQQRGIISNKRGIGYFVEEDAKNMIIDWRREQFLEIDLPLVFKNIYLLDIKFDEVKRLYQEFIKANYKNPIKG